VQMATFVVYPISSRTPWGKSDAARLRFQGEPNCPSWRIDISPGLLHRSRLERLLRIYHMASRTPRSVSSRSTKNSQAVKGCTHKLCWTCNFGFRRSCFNFASKTVTSSLVKPLNAVNTRIEMFSIPSRNWTRSKAPISLSVLSFGQVPVGIGRK
jgi:hypothetical protein